MRSISFLLIFLFLFSGCDDYRKKGPSNDTENNHYYSIYKKIYSAYGTIPYDSTKVELEKYLEEFPENYRAWQLKGTVCFMLNDIDGAINSYRKAMDWQQKDALSYSGIGAMLNIKNELDSAEYYLLRAVALGDSFSNTWLNLALVYAKKNEREKSFSAIDSTLANKKITANTYAGLSYVYFKLNEKQKQEETFLLAAQNGLGDTLSLRKVLNGELSLDDFYRKNP